MRRQKLTVLGSTGSVGRAVLDVVERMPDRFAIHTLAAGTSAAAIISQARRFQPERVVLTDLDACRRVRSALGQAVRVDFGLDGLIEAATAPAVDTLVMVMSGTAGLLPTLAAAECGKRICLATKELLVGYGEPLLRLARRHGATVLPIDSELAALHQCLHGRDIADVHRVILTASGGPFRRTGPPHRARIEDVLRHPTWQMGRKITVDSATLMNKGLEVIETARLFGLTADRIDTVIHPQSIVHSLVEFTDGSMVAQLSTPDMRLPVQYALSWPQRSPTLLRPLAIEKGLNLEFEPVNTRLFPCLQLAYAALRSGQSATCALNAVNEVAVSAFLNSQIELGDIPRIISTVLRLTAASTRSSTGIKGLLKVEAKARQVALNLIRKESA